MIDLRLGDTLDGLKAPFPYFGGKGAVASMVWDRFGDVRNYCEPFAGSLAVLLSRPQPFSGTETVNDADGLLCNFWRAVKSDPDAVAHHADWPVNENDLHARHAWLVNRKDSLQSQLEGDPDYCDAKVAGWWVWGCCLWIGSGWCSGKGPWAVRDRKLVHLGDAGRGINRKLVHLGDAGQGINRKREGDTCQDWSAHLQEIMRALADRLRRVRVCCGDWTRVCGPTPTVKQGLTAVFLDPPYADAANRAGDLYRIDCLSVAHKVREWAIDRGDDPKVRIALCGYQGEHAMPESWACVPWKAKGGYASQRKAHDQINSHRERLWFSPHCLAATGAAMPLFDKVIA